MKSSHKSKNIMKKNQEFKSILPYLICFLFWQQCFAQNSTQAVNQIDNQKTRISAQPSSKLDSLKKPLIEMVEIPVGNFVLGTPNNEKLDFEYDEVPHEVTLKAFKMSKYEITIEQFKEFVDATGYVTDGEKGKGSEILGYYSGGTAHKIGFKENWRNDEERNPRSKNDKNYPVVFVSYNDATAFAKWMGCRLPTEDEWEYACRAGTTTPFYTGKSLTSMQENILVYHDNNNKNKIMPVGSYPPNPWGLFDMHGNVSEICSSVYLDNSNKNSMKNTQIKKLIVRGGNWENYPQRSAYRLPISTISNNNRTGFRIVSEK